MTVVGIISEYNPLHQGHAYHLENARKKAEADACVCVLSSSFVQRGEPALLSKWARARMAISAGADLVLELPSAFSCASAEYFASGAVRILESLNCVNYLCFGSEAGILTDLEQAAQALAFESHDFKFHLKKALDEGLSFAVARQKAFQAIQPNEKNFNTSVIAATSTSSNSPNSIADILNKPNNILGIEYIKAIKRMGGSMVPLTVERKGEGYHSLVQTSSFASATAIRKYLADAPAPICFESDAFLHNNLPQSSLEILSCEFAQGRGPVFLDAYEAIILYLLRSSTGKALSDLPYMGEGLENRLKEAALKSASLKELVSSVVTSRYPASRIKRILCALLTGLTGEFLEVLKGNGYAQYIRVLGFNETGRKLLAGIKKKVQLPIITKPANYTKLENPLAKRLFELEIRATDSYVLGYVNPTERLGGTEFNASPVFIKS